MTAFPRARGGMGAAPLWLLAALGLLLFSVLLSLALGASDIPLGRAARLLLRPDDSTPALETQSLVLHTLRLPRTLVAGLAGAALAVSGLILQGVTRNPLADPGILGVETGGGLGILVMVVFFPAAPGWVFVPAAFLGGLLAAGLAFGVAAGVGLTPLRLALSGVAVASLVGAMSRGIQILFEDRARPALFALSGSVAGRGWPQAEQVAPWIAGGLLLSFLLSRRINLLSLGDDVARGLGVSTGRDLTLLTALGVLLAAAAVSVAGPIGFVGLVVPHLARGLVGRDHRLSVPLSALLGASLLLVGDVAARLIDRPAETPVGLLIAAIGAPFFVFLARRPLRRG